MITVTNTITNVATGEVELIEWQEDDPPAMPPSVPSSISRFQARAALLDAGLLADVEIAIADADTLTQLARAEATEWRRDSPTIAAIGKAIDLTPEQIDDLFCAAAQITA